MTDQMTGRPRMVSGRTGAGQIATTLVPTLLLADADADTCAMVRDALLEGTGPCQLRTVASAEELEGYLRDPGPTSPKPALVLVDLELPGSEGGLETIARLKGDPELRHVPVILLARHPEPTTTAAAYEAGANTVVPKPVTFIALVKLMKVFTAYWLEAAALPPQQHVP